MSSARQILPPTDLEMKLFVKGKLTPDRQIEIQSLIESSPFFQDALDGYKVLYERRILKKWSIGIAMMISILGVFYFSSPSPVEARFAENSIRFSVLHLLQSQKKPSGVSEFVIASKNPNKSESKADDLMMNKNRMIDRFEFPDDSLLDTKQGLNRVEKLQKKYLELGSEIRFVKGYMLLAKQYLKKVNTDVPLLGGVPAQFENKLANVESDTMSYRLISKSKDIDQMIGYYADSLFDKAIEKGECLLKDFPHDVNIEFYLAMSYFRKEDYTKALQHFLYAVNTTELLFD